MFTSLLIAIAVLVLFFGLLYFVWARSGWLSDRRNALARIDLFVNNLNSLSEDYPAISAELDLPKFNDRWPAQRAEILTAGGFVSWVRAGRPANTVDSPKAEALFRFARSKAEPLSFSIERVNDEEPSPELISRIKAVIDPRTGRFLMDAKFVRLVAPPKVEAQTD